MLGDEPQRPGRLDVLGQPSEATFTFIENVLEEVLALFPSRLIHVGGDEAPTRCWAESPAAQLFMAREGLAQPAEIHGAFMRRAGAFLAAHGRQLVRWDEILEGNPGPLPGAVVKSWRGQEGGIAAARQGREVVMTPHQHAYFDHYQAAPAPGEPRALLPVPPLEKVYNFEPVPAELNDSEAGRILGAQGNVWTEWVRRHRRRGAHRAAADAGAGRGGLVAARGPRLGQFCGAAAGAPGLAGALADQLRPTVLGVVPGVSETCSAHTGSAARRFEFQYVSRRTTITACSTQVGRRLGAGPGRPPRSASSPPAAYRARQRWRLARLTPSASAAGIPSSRATRTERTRKRSSRSRSVRSGLAVDRRGREEQESWALLVRVTEETTMRVGIVRRDGLLHALTLGASRASCLVIPGNDT